MNYCKKKDFIIIICLIIIAISIYLFNNKTALDGARAEIYYDNHLVKTVDLSERSDFHFRIDENENVLFHVFEDGSISFEESNCKDKICVNSGKHKKVGDTAACLPNKIVLKIVGKDDEELDVIISN